MTLAVEDANSIFLNVVAFGEDDIEQSVVIQGGCNFYSLPAGKQ